MAVKAKDIRRNRGMEEEGKVRERGKWKEWQGEKGTGERKDVKGEDRK